MSLPNEHSVEHVSVRQVGQVLKLSDLDQPAPPPPPYVHPLADFFPTSAPASTPAQAEALGTQMLLHKAERLGREIAKVGARIKERDRKNPPAKPISEQKAHAGFLGRAPTLKQGHRPWRQP